MAQNPGLVPALARARASLVPPHKAQAAGLAHLVSRRERVDRQQRAPCGPAGRGAAEAWEAGAAAGERSMAGQRVATPGLVLEIIIVDRNPGNTEGLCPRSCQRHRPVTSAAAAEACGARVACAAIVSRRSALIGSGEQVVQPGRGQPGTPRLRRPGGAGTSGPGGAGTSGGWRWDQRAGGLGPAAGVALGPAGGWARTRGRRCWSGGSRWSCPGSRRGAGGWRCRPW
jgi:hypothetical protein